MGRMEPTLSRWLPPAPADGPAPPAPAPAHSELPCAAVTPPLADPAEASASMMTADAAALGDPTRAEARELQLEAAGQDDDDHHPHQQQELQQHEAEPHL